ncbi:hypothetical protein F4778DRAFT_66392 [Xylariomycetidae sp. FL2044]|nr:hypothetical protein F4778DRAFT_66392 [Xylariomycetidae sp. FL2044]
MAQRQQATPDRVIVQLFNHVALPAQLPQAQEPNIPEIESALLDRVLIAARTMTNVQPDEHRDVWDAIHKALLLCKSCTGARRLERSQIASQFRNLDDSGMLVLHVAVQNAGILIYRPTDPDLHGNVIFEFFEASPKRENVLAAKTLSWTFPGTAVLVPVSTFKDPGFLTNISTFLEQASNESIKKFSESAVKAGRQVFEDRDTSDPSLITSLLTALLEANGKRISPTLLTKRVRDEVLWFNSASPWRRLPFWLVLRVAISRYLALRLGGSLGRIQYKLLTCIVHAILLDDIRDVVGIDNEAYLKSKLCRRLFKLERDHLEKPSKSQAVYKILITALTPQLRRAIDDTTSRTQNMWNDRMREATRPIPPLPQKASAQDQRLSLRLSRHYMEGARDRFNRSRQQHTYVPATPISQRRIRSPHVEAFGKPLLTLFGTEEALCKLSSKTPDEVDLSDHCVALHRSIFIYINQVGQHYDGSSEQKSLMILALMEAWVALDETACTLFPLLRCFHPMFTPHHLNVLQVAFLPDLARVRSIQVYLEKRIQNCQGSHATIFDDPGRGCFGERYFDESMDSEVLQDLFQTIHSEASRKKDAKEAEWSRLSSHYETLTAEIDLSTCVYVQPNDSYATAFHDRRNCRKCHLDQERKRMKIRIFEAPLPESSAIAKTVVFELKVPPAFGAYRNATWAILSRVATETLETGVDPKISLRDYSELSAYFEGSDGISLASTAKSWLYTHWSTKELPVDVDAVCLPNALKYAYFDPSTKTWPGRCLPKPTFSHHCRLKLPHSSPLAPLVESRNFAPDGNGPSSYEIAASQSTVPPGCNVHEYMAFQFLMAGFRRRWYTLLTEIGSSNLNLSTESTVLAINHLSLQCGSRCEDNELLGLIHCAFRDPSFCEVLLQQLSQKLEGIALNWRETHLMEIILTLGIRAVVFTIRFDDMASILQRALALLSRAREITLQWVRLLCKQTSRMSDHERAQNCQLYLLWAALLGRRTFAFYYMAEGRSIGQDELATFIEFGTAVYDNVPNNMQSLSTLVRHAFIRDLRMTHYLEPRLKVAMQRHGQIAFLEALRRLWPASETKKIQKVSFREDSWVHIELRDMHDEGFQIVEYNLIYSALYIDGEPLGRLPTDASNTIILTELFGAASLMKYPSRSPGMSHALTIRNNGYQTHIGYDNDKTIIRAIRGAQVLELIPRHVFYGRNDFDLPASLVDECFHWLDIKSGILDIRKAPNIWQSSPNNWKLDIKSSICSRKAMIGTQVLIDPYCPLFIRATRIFAGFELPRHLTLWQPTANQALLVDMMRMQLRWFVNKKGLLQSSHLQAEIDREQSVGTWFGFESKIVCRSVKDTSEQFILVPVGLEVKAEKQGCHIRSEVVLPIFGNSLYTRFMVNTTLGRLDCAAEPLLLYRKAEIHAVTSFILPDPLTGLTGTESALSALSSATSQPWMPLPPKPKGILMALAQLSPRREYYPEDRKVMQKEFWNYQLPSYIQRDEFRILTERIFAQNGRLEKFHPGIVESLPPPSRSGDAHLNSRALHRRLAYHRHGPGRLALTAPIDVAYEPRDRPQVTSVRYSNAFETASLIFSKLKFMATVKNLAETLSKEPSIKGYSQTFDKATLSERLGVDVRQEWGPLVNIARRTRDPFEMMFFLGVIAFRSDANMSLIRALVAFHKWDQLQAIQFPEPGEYLNFRPRQNPQLEVLLKLTEPFCAPPPPDPPLMEFASGKEQRKLFLARAAHHQQAQAHLNQFVRHLLEQWPTPDPSIKDLKGDLLVDIWAAMEKLRPEWQSLHRNYEFHLHLEEVQDILNQRHSEVVFRRPDLVSSEASFSCHHPCYELPSLAGDLMRMPVSDISTPRASLDLLQPTRPKGRPSSAQDRSMFAAYRELEQVVASLHQSRSTVNQRYAADLRTSIDALKSRTPQKPPSVSQASGEGAIQLVQNTIAESLQNIESALCQPSHVLSRRQISWLMCGQLWPVVTTVTLLEQLRSTAKCHFGSGTKENLIYFALKITELQRLFRIDSYIRSQEGARLKEERQNIGHENWQVEDHPDWILLEIESNILIRNKQVEVARAIISPESGASSVLQLNMGQGKTACIIPMAAILLADGKNLVRVSVPKSLLQQTGQLLHGRLGGLIGREICHLPFSRRTPTSEEQIKLFHRIHRDIQRKSGIMLCLPEHQMSFKLSGLQRVLDNRIPEANMMIRVQKWMETNARDLIDESDHTLAVKTQLIYPSGSQMAVDGHPHRWLVVEQLLGLVDAHLDDLALSFPQSIEIIRRNQGFPLIFFLRPDVEEELIRRLCYDVCRGVHGIVPVDSLESADRIAIKEMLTNAKVRPVSIERLSHMCPDRPHVRQSVYLLRGLFVHRILIMTLKKRYGVQYGLNPLRDPVAVPFIAKGIPSEQSEFGHVDVAILLTALAFYYKGLSIAQIRQALEGVLKSDDPASEYDKWTEDEEFPDYLRDWHSINVDDEQQMTHIWSCVRYKPVVVNYFLNNFVYVAHAKQFKQKLSCNGWDIPLFSGTQPNNAVPGRPHDRGRGLTTGFSGTNDIKPLLPLTIRQDDLPSLSHTNAEVLTYLLQPRSREYRVIADSSRKRLTETDFLHLLRRNNIRILIDAGAYILDHDNESLAKAWLKVDGRASVALFFQGDKPWIVSKQNAKTPLLASPYADNLKEVLVYLDEAHTRGTDLKFGHSAHAALTLGLGQTKDHTVQAAMRLRQLGTTQSVVWLAPPEVNQSIRDLRGKKDVESVDSYDVICWLIQNTCEGIEMLQPLYYAQGVNFCNRMQATNDFPDFLIDDEQRECYVKAIREMERQTLPQLYGPQGKSKTITRARSNATIAAYSKELETRRKGFQDNGQAVHASALQEVEQEREIEFEVEAVRQVRRPPPYHPHGFPGIHRDLETFARTGRVPADSNAFVLVFKALSRTALGRKYRVNDSCGSGLLFVSSEFERTVRLVIESANDNFMVRDSLS